MKRTFDNTVIGGLASSAGQISTGQTATKESIYFMTNMVNIQREDHTSEHGIEATFSQTRVLPIVGKTSRAEIGLKSADIQTKALPIFQPQVQIGSDINRLIYEVGLSASWRNSLLDLPKDGVSLPTILYEGVISYPAAVPSTVTILGDPVCHYWNDASFQNAPNATLPIIDTYNTITNLSLIPTTVRDTNLSVLFDYWNGSILSDSTLRSTCLTPVVVGSVSQKIILTTQVTTGPLEGLLVIGLESNEGFNHEDRIRFFGIRNPSNPFIPVTDVFATVFSTLNYDFSGNGSLILPSIAVSYVFPTIPVSTFSTGYSGMPGPYPDQITFQVVTNSMFTIGDVIRVIGCRDTRVNQSYTITNLLYGTSVVCSVANFTSGSPPTPSPSDNIQIITGASFIDGYVINQTSKNGGHIEFLTDQYEFAPITCTGTTGTFQGLLDVQYDLATQPLFINNSGFFRGFTGTDVQQFQGTVELTLTSYTPGSTASQIGSLYNGYYKIAARTSGGLISLTPISKTIPYNTAYTLGSYSFELKLAPNFYTFDTRADIIIDPVITFNKTNFMRNLGFVPTETLQIGSPTYPPTATIPSLTWSRAYTFSWNFSAYRNLTWIPQDLTSSLPRAPLVQQDFGADSGSTTYYNVYEFNKFINDCVNPGLQKVIDDATYQVDNLEAYSLNGQLALAFNAYTSLFNEPIGNFVFVPGTTYLTGDLAISGVTNTSLAFVAVHQTIDALPTQPINSPSWYFLGYVPYLTGDTTPYALCLKQTSGPSSTFITTAVVENGNPSRTYATQQISFQKTSGTIPASFSSVIPVPSFVTVAPTFHYNPITILSSIKYDGYGFGTLNVNQTGTSQSNVALYNYQRRSWGFSGSNHADEWLTMESNSSFKFLFDNFPSYCIAYDDSLSSLRNGPKYPLVEYWIWDSTTDIDPRVVLDPYEIYQSSESLSSCMTPVQSIVVVSENIPVLEELSSPVSYLVDSDSSSFANKSSTVSLTNKIIGELFPQSSAPFTVRSVIKYEPNEIKFYALLDTRLFKQLEYSLYYRHRITQELVPLVLSNYGSINIKFVFRPISDNN